MAVDRVLAEEQLAGRLRIAPAIVADGAEVLTADMRQRITQVVSIFAPSAVTFATEEQSFGAFDPNASTKVSGDRQAVADEIFAVRAERKSA